MIDVLYAIRSDETTHRFVNHSLANLDHSKDVNPFALREPDMFVKGTKISWVLSFLKPDIDIMDESATYRFSRSEAEKYVEESRTLFDQKGGKPHSQ